MPLKPGKPGAEALDVAPLDAVQEGCLHDPSHHALGTSWSPAGAKCCYQLAPEPLVTQASRSPTRKFRATSK